MLSLCPAPALGRANCPCPHHRARASQPPVLAPFLCRYVGPMYRGILHPPASRELFLACFRSVWPVFPHALDQGILAFGLSKNAKQHVQGLQSFASPSQMPLEVERKPEAGPRVSLR